MLPQLRHAISQILTARLLLFADEVTYITRDMLNCSDEDSNSDNAALLYDFVIPAGYGTLLMNGTRVSTFSQKHIDDQLVYFDLTDGKLSISDSTTHDKKVPP